MGRTQVGGRVWAYWTEWMTALSRVRFWRTWEGIETWEVCMSGPGSRGSFCLITHRLPCKLPWYAAPLHFRTKIGRYQRCHGNLHDGEGQLRKLTSCWRTKTHGNRQLPNKGGMLPKGVTGGPSNVYPVSTSVRAMQPHPQALKGEPSRDWAVHLVGLM